MQLRHPRALPLPPRLENRFGPVWGQRAPSNLAPGVVTDISAARGGSGSGVAPSRQLPLLDPRRLPLTSPPVRTVWAPGLLPSTEHPRAPSVAVSPSGQEVSTAGMMEWQWLPELRGQKQRQLPSAPPQAGWEAWPSHNTEGGDSTGRATLQAVVAPRRVRKAKWMRQPPGPRARHRPAARPRVVINLTAEQLAALLPGSGWEWGAQLPSRGTGLGQSSRETLKTQTPTGSTCLHTNHANTHTLGTDTTHETETLPASGQNPSSESLPRSRSQPGTGEAGVVPRPYTASAAGCGGQRSRIPGHRWAWSRMPAARVPGPWGSSPAAPCGSAPSGGRTG